MFSRILVPYDGSEFSNKAVRWTIEHVKSLSKDVEIILLYVVPEIPLPPSYDYGMKIPYVKSTKEYRKEVFQQTRARASEMLNKMKNEFRHEGINNVKTRLSTGNATNQILMLALEEKADLIIIGSIGLSGTSKVKALGSVSRSISERARCPVLIVR